MSGEADSNQHTAQLYRNEAHIRSKLSFTVGMPVVTWGLLSRGSGVAVWLLVFELYLLNGKKNQAQEAEAVAWAAGRREHRNWEED
jgi:hypothetical protein